MTAAQSMILFKQLSENHCDDTQGMNIKSFPATCSKKDRDRRIDEIPLKEIDKMISLARLKVSSQLESRMFVERPSNTRMVLAAMSKQKKMAAWLTPAQCTLAHSLYLQYLRSAHTRICGGSAVGPRASPRKQQASSGKRKLMGDSDDEACALESPPRAEPNPPAQDTVMAEVAR
jgi:hypothetical protein